MKTLKFPLAIMLGIMGMFIFNSCNTEELGKELGNVEQKNSTLKKVAVSNSETIVPLLAGNPKNVRTEIGNVTVWTDAVNLYVKYTITNTDWKLQKVHIYAGTCNKIPIPPGPGQLGYTSPLLNDVSEYTATFPLEERVFDINGCICIAAHAEVYNCVTGISETAWGEGQLISTQGWGMKFEYCKLECPPPPATCYEYKTETAWSTGSRYVRKGNWATYTAYAAKTVELYAGQNKLAGYVAFSAPDADNKITITITLAENWSLQEVNEPVKIQGYAAPPSVKPAPGKFTTYKGSALSVKVPIYAFYGIHLDVRMKYQVPCP